MMASGMIGMAASAGNVIPKNRLILLTTPGKVAAARDAGWSAKKGMPGMDVFVQSVVARGIQTISGMAVSVHDAEEMLMKNPRAMIGIIASAKSAASRQARIHCLTTGKNQETTETTMSTSAGAAIWLT